MTKDVLHRQICQSVIQGTDSTGNVVVTDDMYYYNTYPFWSCKTLLSKDLIQITVAN